MKIPIQIIITNSLLICAVVVLYFLGYPIYILAACGAFFFLLINFVLIARLTKSKNQKTIF